MPLTRVLQLDPSPGNGRNSEGAFITLSDGTLVFAWCQFTVAHDHARSRIVSRTSIDGGLTWSEDVRVLVDPENSLNVMSVSLLRLQDGRIMMVYARKEMDLPGVVRCIPYVCYSSDEMRTFTEPIPVTPVPGYYVVNNDRVIQLSTGRLVLPIALHRYRMPSVPVPNEKPAPRFEEPGLITFFYSDDGENWFESENNLHFCEPNHHGLQEPGVVELMDGRIWAFLRPSRKWLDFTPGKQWQSFSEDGGITWTQAEPSWFHSPNSPMSVKRIPSTGDLLAIWNDHSGHFDLPPFTSSSKARTPLACAISKDDGQTWIHRTLLESSPDHGFCYTAIHFEGDNVLLGYCAGSSEVGGVLTRLRISTIPVAELYAVP